jgi:hypothetical protein
MRLKLTTVLDYLDAVLATRDKNENALKTQMFLQNLLEEKAIRDKERAAREYLAKVEQDHQRDAMFKVIKDGIVTLLDTMT